MITKTPLQCCLLALLILAVCQPPFCWSQRLMTGSGGGNMHRISIGFVYCETEELLRAEQVVGMLNKEASPKPVLIELKTHRLTLADNTLSMSLTVCEKLMGKSPLYAVMIARIDCIKTNLTSEYIATISAIGFTCGYYQIPVIDLYSGEAEFSENSIFSSFVRMSPPQFQQANVWIDIIRTCEWRVVNVLNAQDTQGRMFASRFHYLADQFEINVVSNIEYIPGSSETEYQQIIDSLMKSTSKVFILQAKLSDAIAFLNLAHQNDLMTAGNVWIVSNDVMQDLNFTRYKQGLLLAEHVEDVDLMLNGFALIKRAFETMNLATMKRPASECNENGLEWEPGRKAYEEIVFSRHNTFEGKEFEFDDEGERLSAFYNILNVGVNGEISKVGNIKYDSKATDHIDLNLSLIVWPGLIAYKPDGTKWSNRFRIVTIEEKPFVFKIPKPHNKECVHIYNNSIECPWTNPKNNMTEIYCCYGYCIDLIRYLSNDLEFDYEIYLVPDGLYGVLEKNTWNGLMGELMSDRADMILAPFTINPERATYVEFTKPFKYQGITILVRRRGSESSLVSFLQPFKDGLWVMVLLSVHVVALVLYLLDRFSPFGRFKLSKTENTEEDALNLSRSLWFTWGVLLNSGIGEGTPRSFSARVLGMVWAGFAMIMVASYTANLAAFLVLDRPEASISGINDARLRNPSENYSYATVRGSAVERYFKRQVELSTMFRTMESKNFRTVEDAIEALRNGAIQAFIWDSVRLEYEARRSCDFITTGELFGRSSYGLALKKGNPWLHKLSMEIMSLHENGVMEDLDKEWILLNNTSCVTKDSSPSTLGLTNMAGVFMLVAGGIIVGVFLIFIEIAYKKRKDKKVREHDLSRNAFATWKKNVEKRKLRTTRDSIDFGGRFPSLLNPQPTKSILKGVGPGSTATTTAAAVAVVAGGSNSGGSSSNTLNPTALFVRNSSTPLSSGPTANAIANRKLIKSPRVTD